ncbi:hypothetical protein KR044_006902 [Drosophila immigrans]|nr:hypothetical protein KR044_006902 [Drosophila immigrans]
MQFNNSKFILLMCSLAIALYEAETVVICGNRLTEMLARACQYGYNSRLKRSVTLPDYNSVDTENNNALDNNNDYGRQPLFQAMIGESAHHQLLATRRRRFNIVDECCRKACDDEQLSEYCAPIV